MNSPHPVTMSLGGTDRRDNWWIGPLLTALGLGSFVVYATIAAAANAHYAWGPYLSPFYSPLMQFSWMPAWFSPAFLILGAPAGFRATCYYYRKAYYRAFFFSPPACAVGKGKSQGYTGERAFPFILQNLHRFFLYLAIIFVLILGYDAALAFSFNVDANGIVYTDGHRQFGIGVGTLVLIANVILLSCYTFGCHSLRHLIGGKIDCFSCTTFGEARHGAWKKVSWLNQRHMMFAWLSLFTVGFADFYIRMVAMGVWHDFRLF
jgi:hypothetical protein